MKLRRFALILTVILVSCTPEKPNTQAGRESPQPSPAQSPRPSTHESAPVGPSGWVWIKVSNNVSTFWDTETGGADVAVAGENFSAKLYWKDDPATLRISLEGTIKDGKINAIEQIQSSDHTGSTYTGTYVKNEYAQTINLSDRFGMIGITQPSKQ